MRFLFLLLFSLALVGCTLDLKIVGDNGLEGGSLVPPAIDIPPIEPLQKLANFTDGSNTVYGWIKQSTGKRVLFGGFEKSFPQEDFISSLARLDSDYKLDSTFVTSPGILSQGFGGAALTKLTILSDNSILVWFSKGDLLYRKQAMKQFSRIGNLGEILYTGDAAPFTEVHVKMADDKLLAVNSDGTISKYNNDLSLDSSFVTTEAFDVRPEVISVSANGKIYVGGNFTTFGGTPVARIVRLEDDGTLDLTFDVSGIPDIDNTVFSIREELNTSDIWIGGSFTGYLLKLTSSGTLRPGFSADVSINSAVRNIFDVENDRFLYLGGTFAGGMLIVDGLTGTLASSYNLGSGFGSAVDSLTILDAVAGEVLVSGGGLKSFNGNPINLLAIVNVRTGMVVRSVFSESPGYTQSFKFIKDSFGRILTYGHYSILPFHMKITPKIARINIDGTLDETFNAGSGPDLAPTAALVDVTDRIVLVGSFQSYNGKAAKGAVRILPGGLPDPLFDIGAGFDGTVNGISMLESGKYLVFGSFANLNGSAAPGVAVLNLDGSRDLSFDLGPDFTGTIVQAKVSAGKILLLGTFSVQNGDTPVYRLTRFNLDGSLDSSFLEGRVGSNFINHISITRNNDILLLGSFTDYNNSGRSQFVRLNSDGGMDSTFIHDIANHVGSVWDVKVDSADRIIVASSSQFNGYNSLAWQNPDYQGTSYRFGVFNPDGSLNTSVMGFPFSGFAANGNFIEEVSDGRYLVSVGGMGPPLQVCHVGRAAIAIWDFSEGVSP